MNKTRIAILMTCHNRREKTKECLSRLFNQNRSDDFRLDLYAVDDGSTDGTAEAIRNVFPGATIIKGTGNLFWSGGMRAAFSEAIKQPHDYILWLNDDTLLFSTALQTLVNSSISISKDLGRDVIVTGSLNSKETGLVTYGGKRFDPRRPKTLKTIQPSDHPLPCDVVNGNCVLITGRIARIVGNFSSDFHHAAADYDYSLRAMNVGFPSWIAPGYVGTCAVNPIKAIQRNEKKRMTQRLDDLSSEAALMRIKDSMVFIRKYGRVSLSTSLRYRMLGALMLVVGHSWAPFKKQKALPH